MSAEDGDGDGAEMMDSDDDDNMIVVDDDDVEMDAANDAEESGAPTPVVPVTQVWDPSRYELDENEELDYDRSAESPKRSFGLRSVCVAAVGSV